jgi:cell division protein FtsQ
VFTPVTRLNPPRGAGVVLATALFVASAGYGISKGGHAEAIAAKVIDVCHSAANKTGFRIASISLKGEKQISREEILALAGVTGRTSLLFLDAAAARKQLKSNPWIADASVRKFYPGEFQIEIKEREAFALWQVDGHFSVIAADGTVLEPFVADRFRGLPQVVGQGAERAAYEFLAALALHSDVRDLVDASVLVAERRWNLRLRNGIEVRLPANNVEHALGLLTKLDRDKKLLSRDIVVVDLRLPDRVTIRLTDAAAQERAETVKESEKEKKPKRKGSDA